MKVKLVVALAVLLFAGKARADSTWVYTYTGNELVGCQCSIDGSFTTAAPIMSPSPFDLQTITPLAYSFSVGGFTFDQSNSTLPNIGALMASTDANGDIAEWTISIDAGNNVNLFSQYSGTFETAEGIQDYAIDVYSHGSGAQDEDYLESQQGSWTVADPSPKSVPEPCSLLLSGVGFVALIGLAYRNSREIRTDSLSSPF